MKGKPDVVARLQEALNLELGSSNQYRLHSHLLANWGYALLAKKEAEEATEELGHADRIIQRILFLGGTPNLEKSAAIHVGENVKGVLEADLKGEQEAIDSYSKSRKICEAAADFVTMRMFEDLLIDEDGHIDFIETQMELLKRLGDAGYAQLNAVSSNVAPSNEAGG